MATRIDTAKTLLKDAYAGYRRLPKKARLTVLAATIVPMFAFAAIGSSLLPGPGGKASSASADAVAQPASSGEGTRLRGTADVLSHDLDDLLQEIADAGPAAPLDASAFDPEYAAKAAALMESLPKGADGHPDWTRVDMEDYSRRVAALGAPPLPREQDASPIEADELDLDDALAVLIERIDAVDPDVLDALRDSDHGDDAAVLLSHSLPLMAGGDGWGAAANLLVAHEQADDDATPLVNLAAIANGQNLPAVALALLAAAEERTIGDDDSPVGMREQAALLNNRGHALLLLRRPADAEAPLRQALAMNPELSEAARNLVHALAKLGRDDEARALLPRAVWRLRGQPATPVPVRDVDGGEVPAETPPLPGSPADIARWVESPFVERSGGRAALPMWMALDLSKRGQIAWPEVIYPKGSGDFGDYSLRASARYIAAYEEARALGDAQAAPVQDLVVRRMTLGETIQQLIEVKATTQFGLEPIDNEMHKLEAWKESLILASPQQTRFQALDVARAEYQMARASHDIGRRAAEQSRCPAKSTYEACCAITRRAIDDAIASMTPVAREYEDRMRVFFRDAYGLSTAIASNLPAGGWHQVARLGIEQQVQLIHARAQQEIAFAFTHAAPLGGCYGDLPDAPGEAPEVSVDVPTCSEASQWASGKWAFSDNFSAELTCGKLKFVAEVNVIGTKKVKLGPLHDLGLDLGMHAEIEFTMEGTVTVFAGPKGGVSGKIGQYGGDFGVKDGIYAVIDRNGVKDVGMRVVIGGGVAAGQAGGTHDVESMDFSFVSAL